MFVFTEEDLYYALDNVSGYSGGGSDYWYPKFEKVIRERRAMALVAPEATESPVPGYVPAPDPPGSTEPVRISLLVYGDSWPAICEKARELAGRPYGIVSQAKGSVMFWSKDKNGYCSEVVVS